VESRSHTKARVEQMMGELRRMTTELPDLQKKMKSLTATATSDDGLISATVGPRGQLTELEIDPNIYRRPNSELLAQTIVATVRQAVDQLISERNKMLERFSPADLSPTEALQRMGMPKDALIQHDADILRTREVEDE